MGIAIGVAVGVVVNQHFKPPLKLDKQGYAFSTCFAPPDYRIHKFEKANNQGFYVTKDRDTIICVSHKVLP